MPMRTLPALLAVAATVTAACLSVQSGLQRGGFFAERALWVAVGVVLVVAAHLLPALVRSHGWRVRTVGALLWIGCIAATCYGHAVFFLTAARHAGELRAAAVPVVTAKGRGLAEIARDRADAVTRLARTNARRCVAPCPNLTAERTAAAARVDALDVERDEARRAEAAQDRTAAARAAALADPVTGAMTSFGLPAARADLIAGLAFAGVLEAVACFAWLLALRPVAVTASVTESPVTPAQQGSNAVTVTPVTPESIAAPVVVTGAPVAAEPFMTAPAEILSLPVVEQRDDVTRVRAAINAGQVRPTVTGIRTFLGCSQSRAAAVRRQLNVTAESV
ncbi:hypothetical protein B0G62_102142 [Paraburkholderia eburnea]|uniref:Uncharacterized protein n=1 Tax=Paraburkholderia eburnea TaxID=1189126 RepID=A0A2S4MIE7_9BURK|nr:hypothetical protein [Paraburkholderia eburnea]POR54534.1 hypothetical protein B0G62_102142 [Paraburkholderia eburnea]PRZ19749.1 hypothetical protein BX588_114142 [Paraburkholderia eburnea]